MQNEVRPGIVAGGSRFLLALAYCGFISLGLPDPVAGVAWPSVRGAFSLSQSSFGIVFIALGCGYCASGIFGGKLTQLLGLGNLLWISSALVALAMFGSALAPAWAVFAMCGVIWGLGSGGIDAGLNAYASHHFSARHMNWLHACYSLGATLGPLVMTAMLVKLESWRLGYASVGGVLSVMAFAFFASRQMWSDPARPEEAAERRAVGLRAALRERLVWLQIVFFFFYVGLEFTVGQWSFTLLTESRNVREEIAGSLAAGYYGAIGIGRIIAGVAAHHMALDSLIRLSTLMVLAGTLLFAFGSPLEVGHLGLIIIGLGLASIFPSMMARTPKRLGVEYATHAVGFQVSSGMVGAALVPSLAGVLVARLGLESVTIFSLLLAIALIALHELLLRTPLRPDVSVGVRPI